MPQRTYLESATNYSVTPLPKAVSDRAAEFEATHQGAEIMTVYHVERNQWQFAYATDRGTKRHAEFAYRFTVAA